MTVAAAAAVPVGADPMRQLTLVVPAAAGGGWDATAKAMKHALEAGHLAGRVDIVRYPGAGGLVGLSQLVARHRGDAHILMIGGLVMLGASLRDDAAVSLHDVTPIARLTGEWEMLAVPAASPIRDLADLRRALRTDPAKVRFVGGALGGPDQGLAFAIAGAIGVPYDDIEYYGRAGGRRVTQALAERRGDVGLGGYAEFRSALADGSVRPLAIAAPRRVDGIAAPTLRELGLDATMMNWRAVFAPPGLDAADQDALTGLVATMARSPVWRAELARNRWTDAHLDGLSFSQFIDREQGRWTDVINPPRRAGELIVDPAPARTGGWATIAAILTALAASVGWLASRVRQRGRAAQTLQARCTALTEQLGARDVATNSLIRNAIDEDFGEWKLSGAEADIAWFMLRGLPLKEIADLRGTSERTVRQQAQAIYRKADLDGRSDLAGRVLERFI